MTATVGPQRADAEDTMDTVQAEVIAAFTRYESALAAGDVAVMTAMFVNSPDLVRFGIQDQQIGARALAEWRVQHPTVPAGRRLFDTRVLPLRNDVAVVTTLFDYPARAFVGRQSQTWLRTAAGWQVAHAHVSEVPLQA